MNNSSDFHTVPNLKFDLSKLQEALKQVLKIKKYDDAGGISNFGAICLNQIPGNPDSVKGNYARGIYWTKPDHTGKEAARDKMINETDYTEFVKDFEHTYFKEVYDELSKKYKLGRVRLLLKEPRSTLSWHSIHLQMGRVPIDQNNIPDP